MSGTLRFLLPLVIFPTLSALALYHTFGLLKIDGTLDTINAQCKSNLFAAASSLEQNYFISLTGITRADEGLCVLIRFFSVLISSSASLPFVAYGIGIALPLTILPMVESYKAGRSRIVAYPAVWGLLTQVATVGVVLPIYWLALITSTSAKQRRISAPRSFTTAEAQAIIFGILVGAIIPSVAMLTLNDTGVILIWQFYPLLMSIAAFGHLQWRPKATFSKPGFGLMQITYIAAFVMSSSVHIATVWPIAKDIDAVRALLIPTTTPLLSSATMDLHLLNFLKWDILFAFSSTSLAMLWYTRSFKQVLAILAWYIVSVPTLGFGAAVMGVAIWKDEIL